MPDGVSVITYYSVVVPNKVGEGARVLNALKEAAINLTGFWGYPVKGKKAQMDMVPSDAAAFKKVMRKLGVAVSEKRIAIMLEGEDHPGVLAQSMTCLAEAGISVWAVQAICSGSGRYGAMIQLEPADVRKAKKALGVS